MTPEIMAWGERIITAEDVEGKDVLEVGAQNVNGSLRAHVVGLDPDSYVGVDEMGTWQDGVDSIVSAEDLVTHFGEGTMDLVLSTEMLEHAERWRECVWQMKAVTTRGGLNVITTRSVGFPYHPFPNDWWRFSVGDMERIYADWTIEDLTDDPGNPGVFIRARRPADWDSETGRALLATIEVTAQRQSY